MRASNLRSIVVFVAFLTFQNAFADLTSPSYLSARDAYHNEDWATARTLLQKYTNDDHEFLTKHPDLDAAILKAIIFCDGAIREERTKLGSVGIQADGNRAPPLP